MPDLTTLEAVKQWLAIADAETGSDTMLTSLVTQTSEDFLRAIERPDFLAASYTEVREGDGGSRIAMRHWPINSVASFTISGTPLPASPDMVQAGYYIDTDTDPERCMNIFLAAAVIRDTAVAVIVYNAGYAAVPADVAQAVIEWCALRYRGRDGIGVNSQRDAGGEHVTYDRTAAMPATTAAVAERYKRTWPNLDKRREDLDRRITRINRTTTTVEKPQ